MKDWHHLPAQKLVGQKIVSIDVGDSLTVVELSGGDDISIYLEDSDVTFNSSLASSREIKSLAEFVGTTIDEVALIDPNELRLLLSSGDILSLKYDDRPFESYLLYIGRLSYPV